MTGRGRDGGVFVRDSAHTTCREALKNILQIRGIP